MTIILGIFAFFVILATLILVHEIGHFTFAKLMGVRVDEFGLGFPPRLKTWKFRGTVYSLNSIPLGGFVKMLGENGENEDPDSFGSKPPWQRFIILVAGPSMNILLAVVIFFFAFIGGAPKGLTVVTKVDPHSPAATAGIRPGDRILSVDGAQVSYLDDLQAATQRHLGQRLYLVVQRGSDNFVTSLVPRSHPPENQGPIGIELTKSATVAYSPAQALGLSLGTVGSIIAGVPNLLQTISHHDVNNVAGPIGIAHVTTQAVHDEPKQGFGTILALVGVLSASLGILNLLPIPALDGGRIVFVLLSWVRRRNLDPEIEGVIHMVGMAALLLLILVISYHDIVRWVSGGSF